MIQIRLGWLPSPYLHWREMVKRIPALGEYGRIRNWFYRCCQGQIQYVEKVNRYGAALPAKDRRYTCNLCKMNFAGFPVETHKKEECPLMELPYEDLNRFKAMNSACECGRCGRESLTHTRTNNPSTGCKPQVCKKCKVHGHQISSLYCDFNEGDPQGFAREASRFRYEHYVRVAQLVFERTLGYRLQNDCFDERLHNKTDHEQEVIGSYVVGWHQPTQLAVITDTQYQRPYGYPALIIPSLDMPRYVHCYFVNDPAVFQQIERTIRDMLRDARFIDGYYQPVGGVFVHRVFVPGEAEIQPDPPQNQQQIQPAIPAAPHVPEEDESEDGESESQHSGSVNLPVYNHSSSGTEPTNSRAGSANSNNRPIRTPEDARRFLFAQVDFHLPEVPDFSEPFSPPREVEGFSPDYIRQLTDITRLDLSLWQELAEDESAFRAALMLNQLTAPHRGLRIFVERRVLFIITELERPEDPEEMPARIKTLQYFLTGTEDHTAIPEQCKGERMCRYMFYLYQIASLIRGASCCIMRLEGRPNQDWTLPHTSLYKYIPTLAQFTNESEEYLRNWMSLGPVPPGTVPDREYWNILRHSGKTDRQLREAMTHVDVNVLPGYQYLPLECEEWINYTNEVQLEINSQSTMEIMLREEKDQSFPVAMYSTRYLHKIYNQKYPPVDHLVKRVAITLSYLTRAPSCEQEARGISIHQLARYYVFLQKCIQQVIVGLARLGITPDKTSQAPVAYIGTTAESQEAFLRATSATVLMVPTPTAWLKSDDYIPVMFVEEIIPQYFEKIYLLNGGALNEDGLMDNAPN